MAALALVAAAVAVGSPGRPLIVESADRSAPIVGRTAGHRAAGCTPVVGRWRLLKLSRGNYCHS